MINRFMIECFNIGSHRDGKPDRRAYRTYRIRDEEAPDDTRRMEDPEAFKVLVTGTDASWLGLRAGRWMTEVKR